jgi:hypothetical protein
VEKMVSATKPSSESVEIDPGSPVEVAAFRLARGVVDELFQVRSGGGPLFRTILLQSRMVEGDAAAEVPWPV